MQGNRGEVHDDAGKDHVTEKMPTLHDPHQSHAEPGSGTDSEPQRTPPWPGEGEGEEIKTDRGMTAHERTVFCALVGALHDAGLTANQPTGFIESEGWVFLPEMSNHVELPTRYFE